jgi:hypothetical protein
MLPERWPCRSCRCRLSRTPGVTPGLPLTTSLPGDIHCSPLYPPQKCLSSPLCFCNILSKGSYSEKQHSPSCIRFDAVLMAQRSKRSLNWSRKAPFLEGDSRDEKTAYTAVKRYELRSRVVVYRGSSFFSFSLLQLHQFLDQNYSGVFSNFSSSRRRCTYSRDIKMITAKHTQNAT